MNQKYPILQRPYVALRDAFFSVWNKATVSDDGKRVTTTALANMLSWRPNEPVYHDASQPYHDLGHASQAGTPTCDRDDLVFITARFRSGSTLLWNLFRRTPGCVAYYEPLNERKWFNPQTCGTQVDPTHREVDDYRKEYEGLEDLEDIWDGSWPEHRLYLPADAWEPRLKRYIERLCEHAQGRPVLQFNRADLRVAWLRQQFPKAKLIHLYRHPRDQWLSVLKTKDWFPSTGRMRDFAGSDYFYTRPWAEDLKYHFPFLDERTVEHPYELHYYLWKLSYLYGKAYSHCSIGFEELSTQPEKTLVELFDVCGIDAAHIEPLLPVIQPPPFGKWKGYADAAWFQKHESHCEDVLAEFFRGQGERETVETLTSTVCR